MLKMRDVSSWQGALTEQEIQALDCEILAIKFTEGTGYLSPVAQSDWRNAERVGKVRMAYHFFHPSVSVPGQVRFFLDNVKTAGLESGDMLMLDHESADGMPAHEVALAAGQFVEQVENETHASVIVYTYLNFAETGNCEGLQDEPLFIADPSRPAGNPRVPQPWSQWSFHQFGIQRGVDIDVANFASIDQLAKLGVLIAPPEPTATQRTLKLSVKAAVLEKAASVERLVNEDNLVAGFRLDVGNASFEIL
jgi:lysozyme